MLKIEKPREIAVHVLIGHDRSGRFIEELVEEALGGSELQANNRRLIQELACGVVRWRRTLDWLIDRKTRNRGPAKNVRILLRLGLYQLFWLDRIPDHAAVNETVRLARESGFGAESRFVNAVLRGYVRERDATSRLLADLKSTHPPLGFSHPDRLFETWKTRFGTHIATRLLEWNNTPPKTYARVNELRGGSELLLKQWELEGVKNVEFSARWIAPARVFEIRSPAQIGSLSSFQQGLFYIQDPSTLLAVKLLNPQPGDSVLDLCSAPGGKTTFIAQLMQNRGHIVAHDTNPGRLDLLKANCDRLGATCVKLRGASCLPPSLESFDRILVDAPCSNTGVMRRRIDLRWRLFALELERLKKVQLSLLARAGSQLKPNGTLVYSTCSLESEENEAVVQRFLDLEGKFVCDHEEKLHPATDGVDGCYAARIRRK